MLIYREKPIAIYTFWWCFSIGGGKGILRIVLWCSGLLLMDLSCMLGICGPYISSALFMLYIVIGKFLIWFFQRFLLVSVLMATLLVVGVFLPCPLFYLTLAEVCLVSLYCVQKSVFSNLDVNNVIFLVSHFIIIDYSATFIEHDTVAFFEVNIASWV